MELENLSNASEIRSQEDLDRLKNRLQKHYNHFIDIFSDASTNMNLGDITDYYIEIKYKITLCYEDEEEEGQEK